MSYPGDQQQPGGWGPPQAPQSPYGQPEDQAARGGSPFEPRDEGGAFGAPSHGGSYGPPPTSAEGSEQGPYGGPGGFDGPHDNGPYGGPSNEGGPYENGPYENGPYENGPSFAAPPYDGGPGGFDPAGGDGPRPQNGRKRLIVIGAIVAVVVVVGGVGAMALTSGGGDSKTAAPPASAPPPQKTVNPTPSPTETGRGERLRSRASDPKPLTLNEVFKAKAFKSGGRKYLLAARRSERKCAPPTHGTKFRKAVGKAGCNQVLRATYTNGKLVGTIGVINLRTQTDATTVQTVSRLKDSYVLPLPGAGTTKKIGQGLSLTTAEVDGHYLIMSWVQYPDGKKIDKKDYSAVTSFVRTTTYSSGLRTALNYRSMEGKPS